MNVDDMFHQETGLDDADDEDDGDGESFFFLVPGGRWSKEGIPLPFSYRVPCSYPF